MAHTPGPWIITENDVQKFPLIKGGNHVTVALITRYAYDGDMSDATDANARLIAAAPTMLEACEVVIDERNYQSNSDEYVIVSLTVEEWRAIRDAITKAKGEA